MEIDFELKLKTSVTESIGKDEKEVLMLYEALGKDICKKYGFDYTRLLKMMLVREIKRNG